VSSAEATSADILRAPARATSSLIAEAFVAAGLPNADAARCAELMTQADLIGADGHGIFCLPQYVRRLKAGGFNKRPNITVSCARTAPATALVDGDNGMGHLVMSRAADEAIAMARDTGVAWVGVRRSNHAGPAGLYAEMPAAHGMVGLYAAVANANHMATWGGADLLLGTNPLAIDVPTGDAPLVFDMATSIVAYGTVKKYALRGLTMPEGWFVDAESGAPITDPDKSVAGLLQPMGEYKGSGLALMTRAHRGCAQRRGLRPRRRRFQRRRCERDQYRPLHRRRRHHAFSATEAIHRRGRSTRARFARVAASARRRCRPLARRPPRGMPRGAAARRRVDSRSAPCPTRQPSREVADKAAARTLNYAFSEPRCHRGVGDGFTQQMGAAIAATVVGFISASAPGRLLRRLRSWAACHF
jgi:hypothetical protein